MKKYFISILSVVLALALSAFTKPSKSNAYLYKFEIEPWVNISVAGNVEDEWNWRFTGRIEDEDEFTFCSFIDDAACEIGIEPQYITMTPVPGTLLSVAAPTVDVAEHLGIGPVKYCVDLFMSFRVKSDYEDWE